MTPRFNAADRKAWNFPSVLETERRYYLATFPSSPFCEEGFDQQCTPWQTLFDRLASRA